MKKFICGFLAVVMLVGLLSAGTVHSSAASTLTTSEKAIKLLKEFEGFSKYAYRDNGQYSIGYGTSCDPADHPNGVTEEQADILLRDRLPSMEAAVNKFADRYNLKFSQHQFDALMLFTYNCGAGWTTADSDFRTSVINGDTGNDFVYFMTRWCTASGEVSLGLVDRRMAEADLYLYGYYNLRAPSNYGYALFDGNGGTCESRIQGYDASEPVKVRTVPVYTGYRFLGWYTAKEGGKWITDLDSTTMDITLYAHWQKDEGNVDANGAVQGTAASYQRKAGGTLKVYEAPSESSQEVKTLDKGTVINVTADYVDGKGIKWGKLDQGGWVILKDTYVDTKAAAKPQRPAAEDEEGVDVMVTGNDVNIRSGAGTNHAKVGTAGYGQVITITETKIVGDLKWGKFNKGWICLMYTNYDAVMEDMNRPETDYVASGTVKNCGGLRIRTGPGVTYPVVGTLVEGAVVRVLEIKSMGSSDWGRISGGWICLDYVDLKDSSSQQTPPQTDKDESGKEETNKPDSGNTAGQVTGTVISSSALNIRSGAGTNYGVVGSYPRGSQVTILEQKNVGSMVWGRTNKGWISLNYVRLDTSNSGSTGGNSGNNNNNGGSNDTTTSMIGTVVCSGYLNVRQTPGMNGKLVGSLAKGTVIKIHETKVVGTTTWGRIDEGWISLSYVKLDNGNVENNEQQKPEQDNDQTPNTGSGESQKGEVIGTGKVVGANSLRIRSGAGTNYSVVGSLTMGQSVKIYEVKTVSGVVWGRIDNGWVSMNYIKLDAGSNVVVMVGTVNASSLMIRSAAGAQNAIVGSYARGAKVEIYETATVAGQTWGRTDKGWICLTYVV